MSYTVIVDERERERRFENRLNVLYRHCRIGRVQRKMQILGGAMVGTGWWEPAVPPFDPRLSGTPNVSAWAAKRDILV